MNIEGAGMRFATGVLIVALALSCSGQQRKPRQAASVNVDEEIAKLKTQVEKSPDDASLHGQLAIVLSWKGDWEGSDREANIAMKLDPHNPVLCIEAAERYRVRGLTDKEAEMMNRAVTADPQNPLSHFFLGVMYERRADAEKAMAEFAETKRLIDTLSSLPLTNQIRSRIDRRDGETIYTDQCGKEYFLRSILRPLAKKLSASVDCVQVEPLSPNLELSGDTIIRGHIKDQSGEPLRKSPIELRSYVSQSEQTIVKRLSTDNDGSYDFGVVKRGSYRLLLSPHRGFQQPAKLECKGQKSCVLNTVLIVNPSDLPAASCPIR